MSLKKECLMQTNGVKKRLTYRDCPSQKFNDRGYLLLIAVGGGEEKKPANLKTKQTPKKQNQQHFKSLHGDLCLISFCSLTDQIRQSGTTEYFLLLQQWMVMLQILIQIPLDKTHQLFPLLVPHVFFKEYKNKGYGLICINLSILVGLD